VAGLATVVDDVRRAGDHQVAGVNSHVGRQVVGETRVDGDDIAIRNAEGDGTDLGPRAGAAGGLNRVSAEGLRDGRRLQNDDAGVGRAAARIAQPGAVRGVSKRCRGGAENLEELGGRRAVIARHSDAADLHEFARTETMGAHRRDGRGGSGLGSAGDEIGVDRDNCLVHRGIRRAEPTGVARSERCGGLRARIQHFRLGLRDGAQHRTIEGDRQSDNLSEVR